MKKAQGLPISTIIIAALGLLVLVVIGAIFGGQIFKFGVTASQCPGSCIGPKYLKVNAVDISYNGDVPKNLPSNPLSFFEEVRSGDRCSDVEKPLSGAYIARARQGTSPKDNVAQCSVCCVLAG